MKNNGIPKNILVIRLSAMGDAAMTVPVLKSLISQYPETKITVLSRPFLEPIFSDLPNVNFIAVDLKNKHKGLSGIFSLFFELRKNKFDAVADLHGVLRSHLLRNLFRLSGKQVAEINKGRAEKKALTRTENKVLKQLKTTPERYADVFRELGFEFELKAIGKKEKSWKNPPRLPTSSGIHPSEEGIRMFFINSTKKELSK
ncbi:MAG: glycosyltransferase family 9 protein [Spirosomaceae bacterium]|nr:glycosyltransferase family 9 protein [Spirosomataceae bacterium]